jgi:hypothetical protein
VTWYDIGGWISIALLLAGIGGSALNWVPVGIATLMVMPAIVYRAIDLWHARRH